jgi:hypothetical protein
MENRRVGPTMRPGAMGATYHPPGMTLERATVDALRCRPEAERRKPPRPGDVVGWRRVHGGPVERATVVEVDSLTDPHAHENDAHAPHGPDAAVWRVVTNPAAATPLYGADGGYLYELLPDPWPNVVLRVDPVRDEETNSVKGRTEFTITREARLPGSAGWLPPDEIGR